MSGRRCCNHNRNETAVENQIMEAWLNRQKGDTSLVVSGKANDFDVGVAK